MSVKFADRDFGNAATNGSGWNDDVANLYGDPCTKIPRTSKDNHGYVLILGGLFPVKRGRFITTHTIK